VGERDKERERGTSERER
jgi:hypothetical protein